jgi:hypothetical protein
MQQRDLAILWMMRRGVKSCCCIMQWGVKSYCCIMLRKFGSGESSQNKNFGRFPRSLKDNHLKKQYPVSMRTIHENFLSVQFLLTACFVMQREVKLQFQRKPRTCNQKTKTFLGQESEDKVGQVMKNLSSFFFLFSRFFVLFFIFFSEMIWAIPLGRIVFRNIFTRLSFKR